MTFFSRERILRGALSPPVAVVLLLGLSLCWAGLGWWRTVGALSSGRPVSAAGAAGALLVAGALLGAGTLALLCEAICGAFLALAAVVDARVQLLPDPLLAAAGGAALTGIALRGQWEDIGIGAMAGLGGYVAHRFAQLGWGDVKMLIVLGWWTGPQLGLALLLSVLGAGIFAAVRVLSARLTLADAVPLGPWLMGGGALAWLAGLG
ncbi:MULTISPECIES: prepilin peptidase [Actinotignum]|uniref:A24 family peptidase n=2 Tax=Actinotignum timonense TaxID=1870995 RepID=A0AAW9HKQ2_9ACTO|nr:MULTISPECIES: A24 family peptidase [Actinotignum]MBS5749039.1 prepilin peptidase [Actinotignum schaalii]MDE1557949.1 A24 family peptidase [Actinotignum schaalii]MDE1663310.1 A24 family peptidase [Actinotignum schaalii]MDK6419747.1 A24 family peptidase [Actinotignum timonense]MDK6589832.1 A24 family peptidase [Actinotignum timonense]